MAATKHPNGEITLDKESADKLLTFITQFKHVLNIPEVSQPTQQSGHLHENGGASRQDGPEENDEREKQGRKETLTRDMPGYTVPPHSPCNGDCRPQTMSTGVQANLSAPSTPRNSACVFYSGLFHRRGSQESSCSGRSCTLPGVQPSSARESWDSAIMELTRRGTWSSGRTRNRTHPSSPHPQADDRRPESPCTRQVSVTDCIVRSVSPATCESFLDVVPATCNSNDHPEAAVPNLSEVVTVGTGNIDTLDYGGAVGRQWDGIGQPRDPSERNGIGETQQNDRQALMKISDRITTNVRGLMKKPTYTAEEVRSMLEGIMEEVHVVPVLRCPNNRESRRSRGHNHREAMFLEDGLFGADENATKQAAKRPSDGASVANGEEGTGKIEILTRNKRQRARRRDDDDSFV